MADQDVDSEPLELYVTSAVSGERLDRALARLISDLSRRDAQRLCAEGRVLLQGRVGKKSELVEEGNRLLVYRGPTREATPSPLPLALRLVTPHWVIIAKPALMPTAPRHSDERHALANGLLAAFPEMAEIGHRRLEPGILHRLDNGTSGLLVAARTQQAFERASLALKESRWDKRYLALVASAGLPAQGRIAGRLQSDPFRSQRVRPAESVLCHPTGPGEWDAGRLDPWVTAFHIIRQSATHALVEVRVGPAFRHQIRAHFAEIGAALVNDEVYGALREPRLPPGRHALHAARVAWTGAPDLPGFSCDEPLPADLEAMLPEILP